MLTDEARRVLADALLRAWQDGMRQVPMQWADFERQATHAGLEMLGVNNAALKSHEGARDA